MVSKIFTQKLIGDSLLNFYILIDIMMNFYLGQRMKYV